MSLSTSFVQSKVAAMRTTLTGATVTVRHNNRTYSGVRTSLDQSETLSGMGALQGATGAVRLSVDELAIDHPKAGDTLEIKEQAGGVWLTRVIVGARYDQVRATLRIDYGERYG